MLSPWVSIVDQFLTQVFEMICQVFYPPTHNYLNTLIANLFGEKLENGPCVIALQLLFHPPGILTGCLLNMYEFKSDSALNTSQKILAIFLNISLDHLPFIS